MNVVADGLRQATEIHEQEGIGHRFFLRPLGRKSLIVSYRSNSSQHEDKFSRGGAEFAEKSLKNVLCLNQDLKIFLASYVYARIMATAGYDFA